MKNITMIDFVQELQSFCTIDLSTLERARKSPITTENNPAFKNLVDRWGIGDYDDDLEMVVSKIDNLLFST